MDSQNMADTVECNQQLQSGREKRQGETMSLRPCDTISKRSRKQKKKKKKKKSVVPKAEVAVEMDEEEEEEEEIIIKQGQALDLKALLGSKSRDFLVTTKGNESVPIDSLQGKYVLVCCMNLPFVLDSDETETCRCLEALFEELSRQRLAHNVKLVLVGNIAPGARVSNFDDFFSKLSLNCLAIPYFDFNSRNKVCNLLKLSAWYVPCLVVHLSGLVLQYYNCFLQDYGAESYPFTMDHFLNIKTKDGIVKRRIRSIDSPISLAELLQCDSLSQIGTNMSIPTSDLDLDADSVVGIYLCYDGFRRDGFMSRLQAIHQTCRNKGLKFEIVLLPVPFGRYSDPHSFYHRIKRSASKNPTSSSWWTIPFSDKVCRSLWRLFHQGENDELIILPRSGHPGELHGRHMASYYGPDAYPFTRDTIIERRQHELRSVTLEQLVGVGYYNSHHLHNKNVLLYLDYPDFEYDPYGNNLYQIMCRANPEIKVIYPDSEVVFVPMEPLSGGVQEGRIKKTWPVLPQELCESVINHIFKKDEEVKPSLVAFGKDGKILSRTANERLPDIESLFDDTLASEILSNIEHVMMMLDY